LLENLVLRPPDFRYERGAGLAVRLAMTVVAAEILTRNSIAMGPVEMAQAAGEVVSLPAPPEVGPEGAVILLLAEMAQELTKPWSAPAGTVMDQNPCSL
jgi:hypothetical protein